MVPALKATPILVSNTMKIATLLPVLLLLVRTSCHPIVEDELVGNGNFLDDEFFDDAVSPSLLDPLDVGRFVPRLRPFLQPPTYEFQDTVQSYPDEIIQVDEIDKYSKKPLPAVFVILPPSMVMEAPTREFGLNPKKVVTGHFSFPGLPSLGSSALRHGPRPDTPSSTSSQGLAFQSHRLDTDASSRETAIDQTKDKPTKKSDLEGETTEGRKAEIEEPSRILLPPSKEFFVEIPRMLVPPTEEFSADGSN